MEKVLDNMNECYGCTACFNICPVEAITMKSNDEGFIEPLIDSTKCVDCHACENVCPVLHKSFENTKNPSIICFSADEETLYDSSSGGAFTMLSQNIFKKSGRVAGAAFDEDFQVYHKIIDDVKAIDELRRSKYVQSDQKDCYKQVKNYLDKGEWVLYSGCPCQIAGLNNYLGIKYEKLLTVDLLCFGVPSPLCYNDHLNFLCGKENILNIEMRKRDGWSICLKIIKKNGDIINFAKDAFIEAYKANIIDRPSCYGCKFSVLPRQGDITIGDFWGAKKKGAGLPYEKRSSIVLLNSKKGEYFWKESIKGVPNIHYIDYSGDDIKTFNGNIYKPTVTDKKNIRERFFKLYKKNSFEKSFYKAAYDYNVGLVLHMSDNYGSVATNVALYKIIENIGFNPIILDSERPIGGVSKTYAESYLNVSSKYVSKNDYKSVNELCDIFVLGSDQSANWDFGYQKKYSDKQLLGFVNDDKLKIAYSISFGNDRDSISPDLKKLYSDLLKRFDAISVREEYAVDICRNLFEVEASRVVDPVLLLEKEQWYEIAEKSDCGHSKDYLLAYILEPSPKKKELIEKIAKKNQLSIIVIVDAGHYEDRKKTINMDEVIEKPKFEEWLSYFKNASYVITDSFHGTCFAIVFEKKFISIKARQKNRFDSLAKMIDLDNNNSLFYENANVALSTEDLFEDRDFKSIKKNLNKFKKESINWLKKSLKKDKKRFQETNHIITHYAELYRKCISLKTEMEKFNYEIYLENRIKELSEKNADYYDLVTVMNDEKQAVRPEFINQPTGDLFFKELLLSGERYTTLISCKTDCSRFMKEFIIETGLNLSLSEIPFKNSYCAVLKGNNNIIEITSETIINKRLMLPDSFMKPIMIRMLSCGANTNVRKSSILVNNIEWSMNLRGLNIVIIDNLMGNVVDTLNIDTFLDDKLVINRKII